MKKKLSILSLSMVPALGFAAAAAISGPIQTNTCSLLQDNLTISLSANVVGGADCNVTDNKIGIAACHTSGRKTERNVVINTNEPCGGTDPVCVTGTANRKGPVIPRASTAGGSMSNYFPGAGVCDQATVTPIATF